MKTILATCAVCFLFGFNNARAQSGDFALKQYIAVIDSLFSTQQITEVAIRYQTIVNQVATDQYVASSSIFRLSGGFVVLNQEAGLLNKNPTREEYFPLSRLLKIVKDEDRLVIYLESPN